MSTRSWFFIITLTDSKNSLCRVWTTNVDLIILVVIVQILLDTAVCCFSMESCWIWAVAHSLWRRTAVCTSHPLGGTNQESLCAQPPMQLDTAPEKSNSLSMVSVSTPVSLHSLFHLCAMFFQKENSIINDSATTKIYRVSQRHFYDTWCVSECIGLLTNCQ